MAPSWVAGASSLRAPAVDARRPGALPLEAAVTSSRDSSSRTASACSPTSRAPSTRWRPCAVALCYPSPYHVGMSSLGFQTIYREIHAHPGASAERAFLPDDVEAFRESRTPLFTLESATPVGEFPVLAFSVAYELELPGLLEVLTLAGLPVLAAERGTGWPLVVAGGPLTFSNPEPLEPFVDVLVQGEADGLIHAPPGGAWRGARTGTRSWTAWPRTPGFRVPGRGGVSLHVTRADDSRLPARSQILTPHTELVVDVPDRAGAGLQPGLPLLRDATDDQRGDADRPAGAGPGARPGGRPAGGPGRGGGDRPPAHRRAAPDPGGLGPRGGGLLAPGGPAHRRSWWTRSAAAGPGCSPWPRTGRASGCATWSTGSTPRSSWSARPASPPTRGWSGSRSTRWWGCPWRPTRTWTSWCASPASSPGTCRWRSGCHRSSPSGTRRSTARPFAGIREIDDRLDRLRRGLQGKAEVRPTSARWAWVEYMLAQCGPEAGLAAMDAWRAGGSFAAWKRAFAARGCTPTLRARVPDGRRTPDRVAAGRRPSAPRPARLRAQGASR